LKYELRQGTPILENDTAKTSLLGTTKTMKN